MGTTLGIALGIGFGGARVYTPEEKLWKAYSDSSLTVIPASDTSITLTWVNPVIEGNTLRDVIVERSTDNVTFATVATLGAVETYEDTELTAGTLYYYRLAFRSSRGVRTAVGGAVIGITFDLNKVALWTSIDNENDNYYVNLIGDQDRESTLEGSTYGVVHPGRAISYDGSKSQYSATNGNMPSNFKLNTNSLTIFFKIKMDSAPAGNSLILGTPPGSQSGAYYAYIDTNGKINTVIRHTAAIGKISNSSICDGYWHSIYILINKSGNYGLYVDNVLQGDLTDISTYTFNDFNTVFYLGGCTLYFSGIKYIRDLKVWSSAIISETDRDNVHADIYVNDITSWYFMEEGKENVTYPIRDSVGTNHLINSAFDLTSLVYGAWGSLLNKYGYSQNTFEGGDLISGDGMFDDPTEWTFTATRFEVAGGVAYFKAVDAAGPSITNKRTIVISAKDIIKCSFDITEGSATLTFTNQVGTKINTESIYAVGHHDVVFSSIAAATSIRIVGNYTGGAFKIDNFDIEKYEVGIVSPKMSSSSPTTDRLDRLLTFTGQAKYNLIKVDQDTVKLPDYIGELFDAANLITINDWYDANSIGNEIDSINIVEYQTGRQYYNQDRKELIIIKSDYILSDEEDELLKKKLMLVDKEYIPVYNIDIAIGELEGTTAEIYATSQAIINGDPASTIKSRTPVSAELDATKNYIAIGWADWFSTDALYGMPLINKYNSLGFSCTFYRQIVPISDDPRNCSKYDRNKLKMIERGGSYDGDHSFGLHISFLSSCATYDGRITPSNNDLRIDRGDGNNEFGYDINATVDDSITSTIRASWLSLDATFGASAWKDLTDNQCQSFRASMGVFTMPTDAQNKEKVLESLDYLSNRYCGTTGYSVLNGDYVNRTPNTVGGIEPDMSNKIQGGIFQGSETTCNHEIWERLALIVKSYKEEFEGKTNESLFWSTAGGTSYGLFYKKSGEGLYDGVYLDKEHTKRVSGATKHYSSINDTTRTLIDILEDYGYGCSMMTQGDGYAGLQFDGAPRLEAQRIYKKNGIKKLTNVGDGFTSALRPFESNISLENQNILLTSADLTKALYDMDSDDGTFYTLINYINKYNAWGLIPDCIGDSGCNGDEISSYLIALEALFQYCKRTDITVISHEKAYILASEEIIAEGYNYFPNNTLSNKVSSILSSENAPLYPDGWNGGRIITEDTGDGNVNVLHFDTDGTIFIRQYAIRNGTYNLSFKAKGIGTLIIKKITNKDIYSTTGNLFSVTNTININSTIEYAQYTDIITIPDADLEEYSTPSTPDEENYQNYMRGYGNKICGIQIELVLTQGNYIKLCNCSLIEL